MPLSSATSDASSVRPGERGVTEMRALRSPLRRIEVVLASFCLYRLKPALDQWPAITVVPRTAAPARCGAAHPAFPITNGRRRARSREASETLSAAGRQVFRKDECAVRGLATPGRNRRTWTGSHRLEAEDQ